MESNGGAGEQRPPGKAWFDWWVIAPPACCLAHSAGRLAGVQLLEFVMSFFVYKFL